jgi:hypothetical protein
MTDGEFAIRRRRQLIGFDRIVWWKGAKLKMQKEEESRAVGISTHGRWKYGLKNLLNNGKWKMEVDYKNRSRIEISRLSGLVH